MALSKVGYQGSEGSVDDQEGDEAEDDYFSVFEVGLVLFREGLGLVVEGGFSEGVFDAGADFDHIAVNTVKVPIVECFNDYVL